MAASKCRHDGCPKGLGPSKIRDDVRYCDEHMPGARQCGRCSAWLRRHNKTGFCQDHTPKSAQAKTRHHKDPRRQLLSYARYRAKKKGVEFSVTLDDITVPDICPILGTPLDFSGNESTYPSIDRIRPELGYVPGNVQVISTKANSMKWNATSTELLAFSRYWVEKLEGAYA